MNGALQSPPAASTPLFQSMWTLSESVSRHTIPRARLAKIIGIPGTIWIVTDSPSSKGVGNGKVHQIASTRLLHCSSISLPGGLLRTCKSILVLVQARSVGLEWTPKANSWGVGKGFLGTNRYWRGGECTSNAPCFGTVVLFSPSLEKLPPGMIDVGYRRFQLLYLSRNTGSSIYTAGQSRPYR